ncbi:MAG TPA: VanZ family protein [Firmicutes bacterium]|jgi:VanZ family protein|nr:VanZ family protein [Bacillota bacterium]HOQ24889.1 VanZ family protein [Bacillota bacterium]HPT68252.1 VanZ family protein [Bacillota bacterium]
MSRRQHLDRQRKNFNQRELWTRLLLTPLLLGIVLFLLYTSEDPQWAGSFWQKWLVARFDLEPSVAQTIVFWTRKTLHFVGYGTLSLLAWAVFAAWRAPLAAVCGAAFAVLVAVLDEGVQSFSAFRSGKPGDVVLDLCGVLFAMATVGAALGLFPALLVGSHKKRKH